MISPIKSFFNSVFQYPEKREVIAFFTYYVWRQQSPWCAFAMFASVLRRSSNPIWNLSWTVSQLPTQLSPRVPQNALLTTICSSNPNNVHEYITTSTKQNDHLGICWHHQRHHADVFLLADFTLWKTRVVSSSVVQIIFLSALPSPSPRCLTASQRKANSCTLRWRFPDASSMMSYSRAIHSCTSSPECRVTSIMWRIPRCHVMYLEPFFFQHDQRATFYRRALVFTVMNMDPIRASILRNESNTRSTNGQSRSFHSLLSIPLQQIQSSFRRHDTRTIFFGWRDETFLMTTPLISSRLWHQMFRWLLLFFAQLDFETVVRDTYLSNYSSDAKDILQ